MLRLSLIQMNVEAGNPDQNYKHAAEMLEQAVASPEKPDVILLPEMWNTGYALEQIGAIADKEGTRTKAFFSEFCVKHGVNVIAGSVADSIQGRVKNTIYAFDRQGRVMADYSKIHLFRLMDEEKYLHPGDKSEVFRLEGVQAGTIICYDLRFPELTRKLAAGGAKIVFVPAEWPVPRLNHWRTLLMARAIENQMYVAACNRVGISGGTEFFGHSMVIDPWGEIMVEGGEGEEILAAEIDLDKVDRVRAAIPVFADRRPDLY